MSAAAEKPDAGLALALEAVAATGWPAFAVQSNKRPHPRSHGHLDATTDPDALRALWRPGALPALAVPAGSVVVDLDSATAGDGLDLPPTAEQRTRRGRHLFYRGDARPAVAVAPGVDLRGHGSYVVLYGRWWETAPVAEAPAWVAEHRTREPLDMDDDETWPEGERDENLTRLAGHLWNTGIGEAALGAALWAENLKRCDPPLPRSQVRKIARSARNWEREDPDNVVPFPWPVRYVNGSDAPGRRASRFAPVDLSSARGEYPALLLGLLYRGWATHVYGPTGSAKTLLAEGVMLDAVRSGLVAAHVDQEMGLAVTVRRYRDMGATDDELARLPYFEWPAPTMREAADFVDAVLETGCAVVLMDKWADFLRAAGLEENDNNAANAWSAAFIEPFTRRDVATLILDGTPHDGGHARGASEKGYKVALGFALQAVTAPSREQVGLIRLTCTKDRFGAVGLGTTLDFRIGGDGTGRIVFDRVGRGTSAEQPTPEQREEQRVGQWAAVAVATARKHAPDEGRAVSKNVLSDLMGAGNNREKRAGIDRAAFEGRIGQRPGRRGAIECWWTGDERRPVPTRSGTRGNKSEQVRGEEPGSPVPTRSRPKRNRSSEQVGEHEGPEQVGTGGHGEEEVA